MVKKDCRAQKFPSIQENIDTAITRIIFYIKTLLL